jgi:hypothetical protein
VRPKTGRKTLATTFFPHLLFPQQGHGMSQIPHRFAGPCPNAPQAIARHSRTVPNRIRAVSHPRRFTSANRKPRASALG